MVSSEELAGAALIALRRNLAMAREELVIETARLMGWDRVGGHVQQAIEHAIDEHLAGRLDSDHLGRLKLKPA
jgi:hypothetical protein